jgi:ribosomal-protein-alanine N-acetyltransferase
MIVRSMDINDLDEIVNIEKDLYKVPWNEKQFKYELEENEFSYLFVLEHNGVIVGYYGFWVMFEESDITKVSIRKEFQGMKLSNILMEDCFSRIGSLGCTKINLEVRTTNFKAVNLYKKYGFEDVIVRKNYYGKGEDALILCKMLGE